MRAGAGAENFISSLRNFFADLTTNGAIVPGGATNLRIGRSKAYYVLSDRGCRMSFVPRHAFSRRGFCICCAVAAGFVRTGSWLSPSQAYAEAQNIVDLIRDDASIRSSITRLVEISRGWIKAAEANLTAVTDKTIVIPGHGKPVSDRAELSGYRDMLVAIHENVARLKRQGRSLDDTIAAKPTAAFDAKWGQFVITPALFTRLVYRGV